MCSMVSSQCCIVEWLEPINYIYICMYKVDKTELYIYYIVSNHGFYWYVCSLQQEGMYICMYIPMCGYKQRRIVITGLKQWVYIHKYLGCGWYKE